MTWQKYSRCEHCDAGCNQHLAPSFYTEQNHAQLSAEFARLQTITLARLDAEMRDAEAAQTEAHVYFSTRRRNATDERVIARLIPEHAQVVSNIGSYLEQIMLALMARNKPGTPQKQEGSDNLHGF